MDLAIGLAVSSDCARCAGKAGFVAPGAVLLALLAVVAPWCSFASAFVVAGCGATLILDSLLSRRVARRRGLECDRDRLACELLALVSGLARPSLSPYTTHVSLLGFRLLAGLAVADRPRPGSRQPREFCSRSSSPR